MNHQSIHVHFVYVLFVNVVPICKCFPQTRCPLTLLFTSLNTQVAPCFISMVSLPVLLIRWYHCCDFDFEPLSSCEFTSVGSVMLGWETSIGCWLHLPCNLLQYFHLVIEICLIQIWSSCFNKYFFSIPWNSQLHTPYKSIELTKQNCSFV